MKLTISFLISAIFACASLSAGEITESTNTAKTSENIVSPEKNNTEKKYSQLFLKGDVSQKIIVEKPLFSDLPNINGEKSTIADLIKTSFFDFDKLSFSEIEANKDSFFEVPLSENTIFIYRFSLESKTYLKTKLTVESNAIFEVYNNEKKLCENTTPASKETDVSKKDTDIVLEPYSRTTVYIKVLSIGKTPAKFKCTLSSEALEKNVQVSFPTFNSQRPFEFKDATEIEGISAASISPSGKYILVTKNKTFPKWKKTSYTEIFNLETKKSIRIDYSSTNYRWLPNTDELYFSKTENDSISIYALNLETETTRHIAKNVPTENSWTLLPGEKYLLITKKETPKTEEKIHKRHIDTSDEIPDNRSRNFYYLFDTATETMQALTAGNKNCDISSHSKDGEKILLTTSKSNYQSAPYFLESSLFILNLKDRSITPVFENKNYPIDGATWSPDNEKLFIWGSPDSFDKIGKTTPDNVLSNAYNTIGFFYDLKTKSITPFDKNFQPSINYARWNADGTLFLHTTNKDVHTIFAWNKDTGLREIKSPVTSISVFSTDLQSNKAIISGRTMTSTDKLYIVDLKKDSSPELFVETNKETYKQIKQSKVGSWNFKNSEGVEIIGNYFLPPNFDENKKYPMIVYYYGGTTPVIQTLGGHYIFPLYAAHEYIVYVLQPSGAIGFGQDFAAKHVNGWGKQNAQDIIEGVRKFTNTHSFVNPKKIGCIGASYGGYMTMYLQTQTDLFAAAISHAGISNITSYWGVGYWGLGYTSVAAMNSYPWSNPETFVKQSPLFNADKIKTPLLLVHGEADTNVPIGESYQMFSALKILGKEVEFVSFKNENHGIMGYETRTQWIKTHLAWFSKWLKDDSSWWDALYPKQNIE